MNTMQSDLEPRRAHLVRAGLTSLACASALLLTGCSLDFIPDTAEESRQNEAVRTPAENAPEITPLENDQDRTDAARETNDGADPGSTELDDFTPGTLLREDFEGRAENVLSCPGGTLEIINANAFIELDSSCTDVQLSGGGNVVLAQNIDALSVLGANNVVFVKQALTVSVEGGGNQVSWEAGTPVVTEKGANNSMKPAR